MQRYRTGDQAFVREMNISSVMRYLHKDAPLSRSQLASLTELNKSTVSSLVSDLLERQLIHEVGTEISRTGRPATLLDINPQAGCIIGVELSVDTLTVLLTNFAGQVDWRRSEEIVASRPKEKIIAQSLKLIDQAIAHNQACQTRLLGLGLTLPGMVDIETGTLSFSPNLQWRNVPLGNILRDHTGLPVFVDNDANAAALGEHLFGVARESRNFIFVVSSVGIGGGLFLNGDLYRGAGGLAGEIGHTSVTSEQSRPCRCGNRGCWENFGNQYALIERMRARLDVGRSSMVSELMSAQASPLTLSIIAKAAQAGDPEALAAIEENGAAIGLGIANLINIFNPEMIVLGGALNQVGEFLIPGIQKTVQQRALPEPRAQARIVLSAFGADAAVMGAIALVIEAILSDPIQIEKVPT